MQSHTARFGNNEEEIDLKDGSLREDNKEDNMSEDELGFSLGKTIISSDHPSYSLGF